jgi:hypothetical protein
LRAPLAVAPIIGKEIKLKAGTGRTTKKGMQAAFPPDFKLVVFCSSRADNSLLMFQA